MMHLINELLEVMPDKKLDSFFFWNSGAEAVEAAIKLARHATGKTNVIAVQGGYHGRTLGTMSLTTSKTIYRAGFNNDLQNKTGPWENYEIELFIDQFNDFNSQPDDISWNWGLFSKSIPTRVGKQCMDQYKKLLRQGLVTEMNRYLILLFIIKTFKEETDTDGDEYDLEDTDDELSLLYSQIPREDDEDDEDDEDEEDEEDEKVHTYQESETNLNEEESSDEDSDNNSVDKYKCRKSIGRFHDIIYQNM
eukprot:Pgem_evm1s15086